MNEAKFTWVPFYEEFAHKLLEYKNDRKTLIEKIENVREILISEISKNDITNIDPFSVFSLFNRGVFKAFNKGVSFEIRQKNLKFLKEKFDLKREILTDIEGIPASGLLNNSYYISQNCSDKDIDTLWNLFECVVSYTDDKKDSFVKYFDDALKIKQCAINNLSDALFWIAPEQFISYDAYTRKFFKGKLPDLEKKSSAINYLSYIDFVKNFIKDSKGKFKNFVEVSKAALENNDFNQKNISSENTSIYDGKNILFYGVPGCGKSYHIKTFYVADSHNNDNERVVFHPDYTYSDFIGQILPQIKNDKIVYEFVPGPFTRLLAKAINNPNQKYYLIIEEINRGNAAAIFGDIFQLLDRKNGKSEYEITNKDIAIQVYGKGNEEKKVYIPGNMSIFATMNTADQNVFTLDTAFQRRWQMKHIPNNFDDSNNQEQSNRLIPGTDNITWGIFAQRVNKKILESNSTFGSTADKSLGVYFIKPDEFEDVNFGEKILKYLWDDAFKMNHEEIFNKNIHSLAEALKIFEDENSLKNVLYEGFFSNENLKKDDIDFNESK